MIEIKPKNITDQTVTVPGSKSYTHRIMIATALAGGTGTITNALDSEDTRHTRKGLQQLGVSMQTREGSITVQGTWGRLAPCAEPIYLGNSGTSMRLITALAALGTGTYTITGTDRMQERPIQDLLDSLGQVGIDARSVRGNGCPPVTIRADSIKGGRLTVNCGTSSQFLSALLVIAPYTQEGFDIIVTHGPVSRPYVDMTIQVMERLGVHVDREGYRRFRVSGNQTYQAMDFRVEPDASQAGYFWAAAAISRAEIIVAGINKGSRQGDHRFSQVLAEMGCRVRECAGGTAVRGAKLRGIKVDMSSMPDMVPTLAVVAAFSEGVTEIHNIAHLKAKESDRMAAVAHELAKMGITVTCTDRNMLVTGGRPRGAVIDTYDDHRMAMSFALAGLRVPGVYIRNPDCVRKSFPGFWQVFCDLAD